jgi:Uma2 family endonuclease
MNASFPTPKGRERHKFTVDDLFDFIERGVVPKRAVLLDGGIYDMAADGAPHIKFAMRIQRRISRVLDEDKYFVGVHTTLRLSRYNAPSPDIYVLVGGDPGDAVPPERILLVIEVADTTLDDDLKDSASRYARHGVREYWVVDVKKRRIHVHRHLRDGAYPAPTIVESDGRAEALLIPELALTIDDIVPR